MRTSGIPGTPYSIMQSTAEVLNVVKLLYLLPALLHVRALVNDSVLLHVGDNENIHT